MNPVSEHSSSSLDSIFNITLFLYGHCIHHADPTVLLWPGNTGRAGQKSCICRTITAWRIYLDVIPIRSDDLHTVVSGWTRLERSDADVDPNEEFIEIRGHRLPVRLAPALSRVLTASWAPEITK